MQLNHRAARLCDTIAAAADELRVAVQYADCGARLIDCGAAAPGGLEAGRRLAEVTMAGLGRVRITPAQRRLGAGPAVLVTTDHPILACMASQYAGWEIKGGDFFAMGSGPMRAAASREELFEKIIGAETADEAVGALECRRRPPDDVCLRLAEQCHVKPDRLTLLYAPTASLAGGLQITARSVETALHKLLELGFDLATVESACGVAPAPPPASDDLTAIGRTNDAILYGADVTLWLRSDDETIQAVGPHVPSRASRDYGEPFIDVFRRYDHDFYKIDPMLFSPAVVTLVNLNSGSSFRYGELAPQLIQQSFGPT